jgi:hypothetical protein
MATSNHAKNDTVDSRVLSHLTAANAAWPEASHSQMMKMVEDIANRNEHIQHIVGNNQSIPVKGGFVLEEIQSETFNLGSILQNRTARALTDRDVNWPLGANHPVSDVVVMDNGQIVHSSQTKLYETAHKTANAMREVRTDGSQHYNGADSFIGPSDQVNPVDGSMSISDELRKTGLKNAETRPTVADAADYVDKRVTDHLESKGIEAQPVTRAEYHDVAKDNTDGQEFRRTYQDNFMDQSTLQQMQKAAVGAVAISAVIVGTLSTMQYLKLVKEGKITKGEAVKGIIKTTAAASADSALKAAAATGAVSVVTKLVPEIVAQQAVKGMLVRGGIAGVAICAVDAIECMVMVAAGKMTPAQMETRVGKNVLQTAGGVIGSSIGVSIAASLGATVGFAPVLAGIAGALVFGVAVTIAIENGIEKPYKEVMANTAALALTGEVMKDCSEAMAYGQKAFVGFLIMDTQKTQEQFQLLDSLGDEMKKAIQL